MNCYFGIDIGGTRIKIGAIVDKELIDSVILNVDDKNNFYEIINSIENKIDSICDNIRISNKKIAGIGVSFPGIVDSEKKKVIATNDKYNEAINFDWKVWIQSKYNNCDFYIDNDARLACVGEWKFGSGFGKTDIVMMTIGTGIGTAVVSDNRMLRGKHGQAGNLSGHISVKYDGEICSCGNIGCVEAQASTDVLNKLLKNHTKNKESILSQLDKVEFHHVFKFADQGDTVALEIRNYCLNVWSSAIVNYIHAYDPEVIITGGGIMNSKDIILPYFKKHVDKFAWTPWNDVEIIEASMLDNAAVFGAVYKCQTIKKKINE